MSFLVSYMPLAWFAAAVLYLQHTRSGGAALWNVITALAPARYPTAARQTPRTT